MPAALAPDLGRKPAGDPATNKPGLLGNPPPSMVKDEAGLMVRSHRATYGRMSGTTLKERVSDD